MPTYLSEIKSYKISVDYGFQKTIGSLGNVVFRPRKYINGKSSVVKTDTKTIGGFAAVVKSVPQTENSRAHIIGVFKETINSYSSVKRVYTQTEQSLASVDVKHVKTIDSLTSVIKTLPKTIDSYGSVRHVYTKTELSKSSVNRVYSSTIGSLSSVEHRDNEYTTTGNAALSGPASLSKITVVSTNTYAPVINSLGALHKNFNVTEHSRGSVKHVYSKTIASLTDVIKTIPETIDSKSNVWKQLTDTHESKGNVKRTLSSTIGGLARVLVSFPKTINSLSRVRDVFSDVIASRSTIIKTISKSIGSKATVIYRDTRTVDSRSVLSGVVNVRRLDAVADQRFSSTVNTWSAIKEVISKTVTSLGAVKEVYSSITSSKSNVIKTIPEYVNSKSRVRDVFTNTIGSNASIQLDDEQLTIASKYRVIKTEKHTIDSLSRVRDVFTNAISSRSNVIKTITKTIGSSAAIQVKDSETVDSHFFVTPIVHVGRLDSVATQRFFSKIKSRGSTKRVFSKTIDSLGSVKRVYSDTITSKSNVVKSIPEYINSQSRIRDVFTNTIGSSASIQLDDEQLTIGGFARVVYRFKETISSLSRVRRVYNETIIPRSTVVDTFTKTIGSNAAVKEITPDTKDSRAILGGPAWVSRLDAVATQTFDDTHLGHSRVFKTFKNTIDSIGSVKRVYSVTKGSKVSVWNYVDETIDSKSRVVDTFTNTIGSLGSIQLDDKVNTIQSKARVVYRYNEYIDSLARVVDTFSDTKESWSSVKKEYVKTIESLTRVRDVYEKTKDSKSRVLDTFNSTISSLGSIQLDDEDLTIGGLARIRKVETRTKGAFGGIGYRDIIPKYSVITTQRQSATVTSLAKLAKIIDSMANIFARRTTQVDTKGAVSKDYVKTIGSAYKQIAIQKHTIGSAFMTWGTASKYINGGASVSLTSQLETIGGMAFVIHAIKPEVRQPIGGHYEFNVEARSSTVPQYYQYHLIKKPEPVEFVTDLPDRAKYTLWYYEFNLVYRGGNSLYNIDLKTRKNDREVYGYDLIIRESE